MFNSLGRLSSLPEETLLYCAHEYTLSNGRFPANAEPGNESIARRLRAVEEARSREKPTVPTTVGEERATNPFVRSGDWQEFARLRAEKDSFRS
jgi:hydroxyacylglutathione hydrolase